MLPLNYDQAVLDEKGNTHTLTSYIEERGGGEPEPISDSIVEFDSDDNIQNPTERVSMPLFKGGNVLKDLMRWISKAFQNIRYLLKYIDDISDDLSTTIEKVDDAAAYTAKEWTDSTVAVAGEYYRYNNEIWKCLITNAHSPSPGLDWKKVLILDEVSELNSKISDLIITRDYNFSINVTNTYTTTFVNTPIPSGYTILGASIVMSSGNDHTATVNIVQQGVQTKVMWRGWTTGGTCTYTIRYIYIKN